MNLILADKKITLVYKQSRLTYAQEKGLPSELKNLCDEHDAITQELTTSHENNLRCIDYISSVLDNLGLSYELICRSDIRPQDLENRLVISIGGDGTVLETSHKCLDAPILGVNSDPKHSIGALCIATQDNFREILEQIYSGLLLPSPIMRLAIRHQESLQKTLALNDILYCHQNPAAMSRFSISTKNAHEVHRASGIWIASAAGSTGGIFSAGGIAYPIEHQRASFRVREPYWSDAQPPALLAGSFGLGEEVTLRSNMTDARIYIDGPHIYLDIPLGDSVSISIADNPLWLFNAERLNKQRDRLILPRLSFRKLLRDGEEDRA